MPFVLFILFAAVPFVELALLISLGQQIGFWPTIALVIATAILGAVVLNRQGLQTMQRISAALASGEPPIQPVVDGFFLVIAGAFLLTPGVLTDAIGLALLVPAVRRALARWGFGHLMKRASFTVHTYRSDGREPSPGAAGPSSSSTGSEPFASGSGPSGEDDARPWQGPGRHGDRKPRPRPSTGPVIEGEFEEIDKKP